MNRHSLTVASISGNFGSDVMLSMGLCKCFGSNLGMAHDSPTAGDRICRFTPGNLSMVLHGLRTLDFRKFNNKPGRHLIGCGGRVHGIIQFHRMAAIESPRSWARMRTYRKSLAKTLPCTPKTFVFRISVLKTFMPIILYMHQQGAVKISNFRN